MVLTHVVGYGERTNMKLSRTWATPLAACVFLPMAVTGVMMFFHVGTPLGKEIHEWLGWGLVAGITLHVTTNWAAFKGHLKQTNTRIMAGVFALLLLASVLPIGGEENGKNGSQGAVSAISRVPLRELAPIAGRDVETIVNELHQAGFDKANADSSVEILGGKEREDRMRILGVVFPSKGEKHLTPRGIGGLSDHREPRSHVLDVVAR